MPALLGLILSLHRPGSASRSPNGDGARAKPGSRWHTPGSTALLDVDEGHTRHNVSQEESLVVAHGGQFQRLQYEQATSHDPHGQHHKKREGRKESGDPDEMAFADHHIFHEESEASEHSVGFTAGFMLFALTCVGMCGLYLLNSQDPQLKNYGHKLVFYVAAIISSLTLVHAMSGAILEGVVFRHLGIHGLYASLGLMIPVVFWYFSIRFLCRRYDKCPDTQFFVAIMVSHIAGFSANDIIDGIDIDATSKNFEGHSVAFTCFLCCAAPLCFRALAAVHNRIFDASHGHGHEEGEETVASHGHGHEHEPHWMHFAEEGEDEASAIVFGFCVKQFWVAVSGSHQSHDHGRVHPDREVYMMMFAAVLMGVLFIASSIWHQRQIRTGKEPVQGLTSHLSLAWAYVTVCACRWWVYTNWSHLHPGTMAEKPQFASVTLKRCVTAFFLMPICVIMIIVMDRLADRGYVCSGLADQVLYATSVVISISWEEAFERASETIWVEIHVGDKLGEAFAETGLGLFLFALIAPGMFWYIVPKARLPVPDRAQDKGGGQEEVAAAQAAS